MDKNITLNITGMTCMNCKNRIERKLRKTDGISRAEVNYSTNTAEITYKGTGTSEGWYAGYAVGTTDTNTISKLKDRATEDGLLGAAGSTTAYTGESQETVYMRVH